MSCNTYSHENNVPEVSGSIHKREYNTGWMLAPGFEIGVISLSVFGIAGNRHSIIVVEKEHLNSGCTGRDGKWLLMEIKDGKHQIGFNLEWAVEAPGSGCLVLCGR